MTLNTTTSNVDGVFVVYLSGAIRFGEESASLRNLVKDLLSKSSQIVLDLGDVTYIDSGGAWVPWWLCTCRLGKSAGTSGLLASVISQKRCFR